MPVFSFPFTSSESYTTSFFCFFLIVHYFSIMLNSHILFLVFQSFVTHRISIQPSNSGLSPGNRNYWALFLSISFCSFLLCGKLFVNMLTCHGFHNTDDSTHEQVYMARWLLPSLGFRDKFVVRDVRKWIHCFMKHYNFPCFGQFNRKSLWVLLSLAPVFN